MRTAAGRPGATPRPDHPPTVDVPLTPRRTMRVRLAAVRLNLAWLLFGAFGLTALLATVASWPQPDGQGAPRLSVLAYVLALAALAWAGIEMRAASRLRAAAAARRRQGRSSAEG